MQTSNYQIPITAGGFELADLLIMLLASCCRDESCWLQMTDIWPVALLVRATVPLENSAVQKSSAD